MRRCPTRRAFFVDFVVVLSSIVVVVVDLADLNGSANRGLAQLRTAAETVE